MSADGLKEWLMRRPFEPFTMTITSGETFSVSHPDQVWVGKTRCTVADRQEHFAERAVDIALVHVVSIEPVPPPFEFPIRRPVPKGETT